MSTGNADYGEYVFVWILIALVVYALVGIILLA